jgi:DNA end-binding protein Ku
MPAAMAARAMWKGTLRAGKIGARVKLYAAVEDRDVHFHLLSDEDEARVHQKMVNPRTGEPREDRAVKKGYEVEPGTFVVLSPEELEAVEPKASRDVEILAVVPRTAIGPAYHDRPYFLGPDGDADAYFAIAQALREGERVGIARWVMRGREHHGVLRPEGEHLLLVTLRPHEEVVEAPRVEPAGRAADARELAMAEQLVTALEGEFDPKAFEDEHRKRVLDFVTAKAKGKKPKLRALPEKRATTSLGPALAKSLEHVKKERKSA